jgi:hypothetical protein
MAPLRSLRLRIYTEPYRALHLASEPRKDCLTCLGAGEFTDVTGASGRERLECLCWNPSIGRMVLPLSLPVEGRMRPCFTGWPHPAIEMRATPQPDCPHCSGQGGVSQDYAGPDGDYGGTNTYVCFCWNPGRRWRTVLPVPRWVARRFFGWVEPVYSSEPPF